jgi:hypothetical protein
MGAFASGGKRSADNYLYSNEDRSLSTDLENYINNSNELDNSSTNDDFVSKRKSLLERLVEFDKRRDDSQAININIR